MSKTVQQSLLVLGILLLISIGSAVFILVQKQQLAAQNEYLQGQLTDAESRAQMLSKKAGDLESQLSSVRRDLDEKSRENKTLEKKASDADAELRRAKDDMSRLERDKREWDDRLQKMTAERDRLTKELQNRPTQDKIVEKVVEKVVTVPAAGIARSEAGSGTTIVVENKADEEYWAKVLKEKSALEIEIGDAKEKAAEAMLKVEEAKKTASDLEIEVGRLKNEREAILRKIKYGEELADNLSIELARSRNEQRVIKEMADRVSAENQQLRSQVKELTSTKVALERSVSRLSDEKATIERKLIETENIIQGRIDDIWQIKKDIDKRFEPQQAGGGAVELAPIVVNASVEPAQAKPEVRRSGEVVSVNEANNFVIVNLGQKDGVRVGDTYKVYRAGKQVGTVSIIQVRSEISAADIRQRTESLQPGDAVR